MANNMTEHLIDVVIPVFNGAKTVRSAVESIKDQTVRGIKILIVDDGSTDDTPHILTEIAGGDARVKVIRQPHGGVVAARNTGLAHCRAEFVALLDADDLAYPHRFAKQLAYLQEHPECVAVSGAIRFIDELGFLGDILRLPSPDEADAEWVPAKEPYLIHSCLMARLSALRAVGGYRNVVYSEDSDLYWRIHQPGKLHNMDTVLGGYRMHNASISGSSINNGRTMALSSQLAAISAVRRRLDRTDVSFPVEAAGEYRAATSLAEIFTLGCRGLTSSEIPHLEIALAAKLLELAAYRPYELELTDCRFIRTALTNRVRSLNPKNKTELMHVVTRTGARLVRKRRLREAFALVPFAQYPRATKHLAKRFASLPFSKLT
jgi:glycosyltransferase involved in cell wall biosynthesis